MMTELEKVSAEAQDDVERVRATLRIYHPELEPDAVTELLGIEPSVSWKQGDQPYGWTKKPGHQAPSGGWLLSSRLDVRGNDAMAHIEWLLDQVVGSATRLKQLQDKGFMVDVVVAWHAITWNTTPTLTPHIMRRLAKHNLPVWFDIYLNGQSDEQS